MSDDAKPPIPNILDPAVERDERFDPPDERAASVDEAKAATKASLRAVARLVKRTIKRHLPPPAPPREPPPKSLPQLTGRLAFWLPILRVVPWVLAVLFVVSFVWDFPGIGGVFLGRPFTMEGLLRILSVSGLIGFLTNWVAITMLFKPREKRPIVPQGLIPAQRERVVVRLAQAISEELINADLIKAKIQESGIIPRYRERSIRLLHDVIEDPGFRSELKALTTEYAQTVLGSETLRRELARVAVEKIEQQAGRGVGGAALKLYRTFNEADFQRRVGEAIAELPAAVDPALDRLDRALDRVPALAEEHAPELERLATRAVLEAVGRFDVYGLIVENARGFDEQRLEDLLKKTSNEQLNYIKYLGALLGVVGGFVIWEPVPALVVLAALGGTLWAADEALYRMRDRPE